jgi:hypothetical protein
LREEPTLNTMYSDPRRITTSSLYFICQSADLSSAKVVSSSDIEVWLVGTLLSCHSTI